MEHVPRVRPHSPASIDPEFVEIGLVQLSQSVKTTNAMSHTYTQAHKLNHGTSYAPRYEEALLPKGKKHPHYEGPTHIIWTPSVRQLYRTVRWWHAYGTYYVVLFSLVSWEVAHCVGTIPGMIYQRRRRDGQDSHDAITSVFTVVSPPLPTHIGITRRR